MIPLAWLNDALLPYDLGHALLVGFVLAVPGAYFKTNSEKVLALLLLTFGALFALVPSQAAAGHWRFFGYALVLVAPLVYVLAQD